MSSTVQLFNSSKHFYSFSLKDILFVKNVVQLENLLNKKENTYNEMIFQFEIFFWETSIIWPWKPKIGLKTPLVWEG